MCSCMQMCLNTIVSPCKNPKSPFSYIRANKTPESHYQPLFLRTPPTLGLSPGIISPLSQETRCVFLHTFY